MQQLPQWTGATLRGRLFDVKKILTSTAQNQEDAEEGNTSSSSPLPSDIDKPRAKHQITNLWSNVYWALENLRCP